MSFSIRGRFREQVRFLRRQFVQDGELPFTDALQDFDGYAAFYLKT